VTSPEVLKLALAVSPEERLDLARRLADSVVEPAPINDAIGIGIRRIEDLASGRVHGLSDEEFRATLR
jgi:putative addiction module component (TIGR02574 family)